MFYHEFHPRDISLPRHVQLAAQRSVVSLCSTPSPPLLVLLFRPFSFMFADLLLPSPILVLVYLLSCTLVRDISSSGSPRGLSQGRTRIYLPTGSPTDSRNRYISSKPIAFSFFFALRTRAIYAPRVILFRPSGTRCPVCSFPLWVKYSFFGRSKQGESIARSISRLCRGLC